MALITKGRGAKLEGEDVLKISSQIEQTFEDWDTKMYLFSWLTSTN